MKQYIYLLQGGNKKTIFIFFILNILLILFETFGIAIIPLFISYIVNPEIIYKISYNPLIEFLQSKNYKDIIYLGVGFLIALFFLKNLF